MAQKVFIYACENTYGGFHGMYEIAVEEIDSIKEAHEIAEEMSLNVMDSYHVIIEDYRDQARELMEDEYDNFDKDNMDMEEEEALFYSYMDEIIEENICYSIYLIKDKYQNLSVKELYNHYQREGYESFVNKYCDELLT